MKKSILLFIIIFSIFACTKSDYVEKVLTQASDVIYNNPDSALVILNTLKSQELVNKGQKAKYALLKTMAVDKIYESHSSDSLINIAVKYYRNHGDIHTKALTYYNQGRVYRSLDSLQKSATSFFIARSYIMDTSDSYLKGLIYYNIGEMYQSQFELENSRDMIGISIRSFEEVHDTLNIGLCYNLLARNYYISEDYHEALSNYYKAKKIFDSLDNMPLVISNSASIANVYLHDLGQADKALEELERTYDSLNDKVTPIDQYPLLSYIHYSLGNVNRGIEILNEYLKLNLDISKPDNAVIISMLSEYEAGRDNYKQAYEYLFQYVELIDNINEDERKNLVLEIEKKYAKQELQNRYDNYRNTIKYKVWIGVLGIIIVIFILLLVLRSRNKKIHESRRAIEELEQYVDRLSTQIEDFENMKERLSYVLNEKDEKETRLKEVLTNKILHLQKLLDIASIYNNRPEKFITQVKQSVLEGGKDVYFGELQEIVNDKFHGIVDYLKINYPDLSDDELNLCCLICFGFTNNQISILFGHTNSNSIFTKRHKLRKKIGLWPRYVSIESFIADTINTLTEVNQ